MGDTVYWAVVPKAFVSATGQRWQLVVAPPPDEAMVWHYRFRVLADILTDAAIFPLGGAQHTETIKAASIADAEFVTSRTAGFAENRYQELMGLSIDADRELFDTDEFEQMDSDYGVIRQMRQRRRRRGG